MKSVPVCYSHYAFPCGLQVSLRCIANATPPWKITADAPSPPSPTDLSRDLTLRRLEGALSGLTWSFRAAGLGVTQSGRTLFSTRDAGPETLPCQEQELKRPWGRWGNVCQPVSCVKRVGRAPWTSSESPGGCGQRSCQCSGQKLLCRKSQKGTSFRQNPGPFWKRVSLRPRTVLTLFPTQPNCWLRVIQEDTKMHQPSLLFL